MALKLGVFPAVTASVIIARVRYAAQGQMSQWGCSNLRRRDGAVIPPEEPEEWEPGYDSGECGTSRMLRCIVLILLFSGSSSFQFAIRMES